MTQVELRELKTKIPELYDRGFICPSASDWGGPFLFFKRIDNSMKMCIYYKQSNEVINQNKYQLFGMDNLIDQLQGASFLSII